jgi:hypothetical protein
MALPKSYLTSTKNLSAIFVAIRGAEAPKKFTYRFLEGLDFKSNADRLVVGVLKALGFLDSEGKPTDRYFDFLDQTQSGIILAEAVREAYADLFQINKTAQNLSNVEVVNKIKTLTQGQYSKSVTDKMGATFLALCRLADFKNKPADEKSTESKGAEEKEPAETPPAEALQYPTKSWGGLHYNIQIIMPESRDPKVYDALFRSLKEHLM